MATGGAAQGQGGLFGNLGNVARGFSQDESNVYGNVTSGLAKANTDVAQADMQGSANLWGGLLNLGKMATGFGGKGLG